MFETEKENCGPCGMVMNGVIKGKFENGYIITANYGSDVLKGFLYHVQPNEQQKPATKSAACIQKKRSKKAKDPLRPKAHRSGYNFFFAEQCANQQKPVNSREERAIQIGDKWNKLDAAEKEAIQSNLLTKLIFQNSISFLSFFSTWKFGFIGLQAEGSTRCRTIPSWNAGVQENQLRFETASLINYTRVCLFICCMFVCFFVSAWSQVTQSQI